MEAARRAGVEKLLILASICICTREAPQPMREDYILAGVTEPTSEAYALANIAGIKLCQAYRRQHGCDFISAMPTNIYELGDNFEPNNSHVPAALLYRFHKAKQTSKSSVQV